MNRIKQVFFFSCWYSGNRKCAAWKKRKKKKKSPQRLNVSFTESCKALMKKCITRTRYILQKTHSRNRHSAILSRAAHRIILISVHVRCLHLSAYNSNHIFTFLPSFVLHVLPSSRHLLPRTGGKGGGNCAFFFPGPFPGERKALECRPSHSFP